MKRMIIWAALFALLISACAGAQPTTDAAGVGGKDIDSTEEAQGSPETGADDDVVIFFERSGGLQGKTDSWTIYPDGRVVTGDGQELAVAPEAAQTLAAEMENQGFWNLKRDYAGLNQCRDCFQYTITLTSGGQTHTVKTIDAATGQPEALSTMLGMLSDLVRSAE